jgi:serine/threonine protein kinase
VTIYDVGEERGLAYIAMEYLKGRHLSDYATSNNLLEPRKVLEVIGRTAEALGFAHKQQVVHRDIKPANLMYDPSTDVLKITDFGIARSPAPAARARASCSARHPSCRPNSSRDEL